MKCLNRLEPIENIFVNVEYDLLRVYFEENGFWVRQDQTYSETGKKGSVFPFFEILRASNSSEDVDGSFRLFTGDLTRFNSAIVSQFGWQDTGFSADMLSSDVRLMKFYRKNVESLKTAWETVKTSILLKEKKFILILPALPKSENKTSELFNSLRTNEVQGVLTMSSVLENLLRKSSGKVETRGNSTFHLLKLLRVYGLATEPQLGIFDQ